MGEWLVFLVKAVLPMLIVKVDACNEACHFATDVPRRALRIPMVLYAILAMASRYEAILKGVADLEASIYHGRCLKLLIQALSGSKETYDENLLVAVIILRLYEEIANQEDNEFHLLGMNRLLNSVEIFSSSGGLGEAASWQSLRQAVYISLVRRQPLELNLEKYRNSAVFLRRSDANCANVMVFIFAKMVKMTFSSTSNADAGLDNMTCIENEIHHWYQTRPSSFQPFHYEPCNLRQFKPFPDIWMMAPAEGISPIVVEHNVSLFRMILICPSSGGHAVLSRCTNSASNGQNIQSLSQSSIWAATWRERAFR